MKSISGHFLFASLIFWSGQFISAQNTDHQNFLFIFDASGSMWTKMDKTTRIQVAKETLYKLSEEFSSGSNVGLIAYGHKSASDCNDIETLLPVNAFDKAKFNATIRALNPKGKTPIAKSVNHALSAIQDIHDPVNIILVSDGLETCEGNACEIVKKVKASGIKFTMHVVGFGISEQNLSPLECIAQAGGGLYIPANNAEELTRALEKTVKEIPSGDAFLSVKTTLNGSLKDATVKVYKKGEIKEYVSGRTYESGETNPRLMPLPAGVYEMEIKPVTIEGHPGIRVSDMQIKAKDTLYQIIEFEQVTVEILITRNGALSDATVQLFPAGVSNRATATTRSYTQPTHNPAILKIPPGTYDIIISSVEIRGRPEHKILNQMLGNGGKVKFSHNFESGELRIGAKNAQGLVDATIGITHLKTGKNAGAGRTYQDDSNNPKSFLLEPGTYRVDLSPVKPAGLGKKSITIEITAKEVLEKILQW